MRREFYIHLFNTYRSNAKPDSPLNYCGFSCLLNEVLKNAANLKNLCDATD